VTPALADESPAGDITWHGFCVVNAKIAGCGGQSGSGLESRFRTSEFKSQDEV